MYSMSLNFVQIFNFIANTENKSPHKLKIQRNFTNSKKYLFSFMKLSEQTHVPSSESGVIIV